MERLLVPDPLPQPGSQPESSQHTQLSFPNQEHHMFMWEQAGTKKRAQEQGLSLVSGHPAAPVWVAPQMARQQQPLRFPVESISSLQGPALHLQELITSLRGA